jgi:L-ascorbate metabolism protein UlaG (beta-lactamase superfamily)
MMLARTTIAAASLVAASSSFAAGPNVAITPLGSHDGEFCSRDRALVFEDPNGTRVLYDAGLTVRGADDPRLGKIDIVLLSHEHGDHLGNAHAAAPNAGTCGAPEFTVNDQPSSNTEKIVVAKKAKFPVNGELNSFFPARIKALGGDPSQLVTLRTGASTTIDGVEIAVVQAAHPNGLDAGFLTGDLAKQMKDAGVTAYVGQAGGYVVKFTNGLTVYLSGDTGVVSDMKDVVHDFYHANLAVINMGGSFTTGPKEAAYVINDLVKPKSVIPSHSNEGETEGGKVLPNTKTAAFEKLVKVPMHPPLSGKTMEFDGSGKCVSGC